MMKSVDDHPEFRFKILFIGDSAVGKTSLLQVYFENKNDTSTKPTVGVDFMRDTKIVTHRREKKKLCLTIWDTAGQERFRTLISSYFRSSHAALLVYDVSRPETFEHVENWNDQIDQYSTYPNIVKVLIGNKNDLVKERKVSREQGENLAQKHGMIFLETSKFDRSTVVQALDEACFKILDDVQLSGQGNQTTKEKPEGTVNLKQNNPSGEGEEASGCCW
mmetsp:Transcript_6101/g.8886  ORF Transcript_6101/g.8886 Transcript_6101/m.8886 type:complete len:220 (+) Transcript_6101:115-774(+)